VRVVTRAAKYGGKKCAASSISNECNNHVCAGYFMQGRSFLQCNAGTFQPNSFGQPTSCYKCSTGAAQALKGQASCTKCAPGHYAASQGQATCTACAAGTSQALSGAATCIDCAVGTFSPRAGSVGCAHCIAGTYSAVTGASVCTKCAKGHYNTQAQRTGCSKCQGGTYQDVTGATGCKNCEKGTAHNIEAAVHVSSCVHCKPGNFAKYDGSKRCLQCKAGTYTTTHKTHTCAKCVVVDKLRFFWTKNEAGWAKPCVAHALHCKVGVKPQYTKCTKSCGTGTQHRHVKPAYHAWGNGRACAQTSSLTGAQKGVKSAWVKQSWKEIRFCNSHPCPIDCTVSRWTKWSTCTKSCASGKMSGSRKITRLAKYGGKKCPALKRTSKCNQHTCKFGECHQSFVKCTMENWSQLVKAKKGKYNKINGQQVSANSGQGYGRFSSCNNGRVPANRMEQCHKCDTKEECKAARGKNNGFTLHVQHLKKFSFIRDQFSCSYDRKSLGKANKKGVKCTCLCRTHPTGCFKKNYKFASLKTINGNHFKKASINACSTACGHHPKCQFWEFNQITKMCILKQAGKVSYTKAKNTFAGKKPTAGGCVGATKNYWASTCSPGTFSKSSYNKHGKYSKECLSCPKGKYNPVAGRKYCLTSPKRTRGMSLQQWFRLFKAN
jgi:hypothetical protein